MLDSPANLMTTSCPRLFCSNLTMTAYKNHLEIGIYFRVLLFVRAARSRKDVLLTTYFLSPGGPGVFGRGEVEPPLLSIARLSEQSLTSVINPSPSQMGQWSNSSYHSLAWHLKPLGRGTPIYPCLCVSCHTKGAPAPWSFILSFLVSTKEAGVKINFHPPSHEGRVAELYINVVM